MFKNSDPISPNPKTRNSFQNGYLTPNDYGRDLKTPDTTRKGSVDPMRRPESINVKEVQGRLHSIRERMKS